MSVPATVFDRLVRSRADLAARLDVGRGRGVAIWTNEIDRVTYDEVGLHTLSLYLEGGRESRRVDRGGLRGRPGALVLMPRGSRSDWAIGGRFRFVHLYLDDARLKHFAAETLDRDPGRVALADLTFFEDPALVAAMRALALCCERGDAFAADGVIAEVCHRLLTVPSTGGRPAPRLAGGLAPAASRRVVARMRERLDAPPTLDELAAEAGLSPFHFQRMFRASHGLSPHRHLEALRVDEARRLMRSGVELAEVAAACGWCHQSAFTRAFRETTGLTPGAWRAAAIGADGDAGTGAAAAAATR